MYHLGTAEIYAEHIRLEAMRDASHQHLLRLAKRPGTPARARLATWLHALAARIDDPLRLEVEAAPI
jgi:hypothetical protein